MRHEGCDWAVAGQCDFCGHRTSPDNLMGFLGSNGEFCDRECYEAWKREKENKERKEVEG